MASVAVGLSVNLPAGRVMCAWVEGEERVVWRSEPDNRVFYPYAVQQALVYYGQNQSVPLG